MLLLIITAHLTLYAKYKKSNRAVPVASQAATFQNIKFVSLRNIAGGTVKFVNATQVERGKDEAQYARSGDTLLITGNDAGHGAAFNLPNSITVSVVNSSVSFKGESAAGNDPVIYLQNSKAVFGAEGPVRLGRLKLVASGNSTASFVGNVQANDLEVQLSGSAIEDMQGDFGRLTIITDSLSRVSLQSKHLLKANIKTITRE